MSFEVADWQSLEDSRRTVYFREYRRKKRGSLKHKASGSLGEFLFKFLYEAAELVRKSTHDFEYLGKKFEVKTSSPREGAENIWEFHTREEQRAGCDFFYLLCLDQTLKPVRIYAIPSRLILRNTIRIGIKPNTTFEKFRLVIPEN